jgi:serine/threonine-protein kinase
VSATLPDADLWARAQELFLDALEQPTAERNAWVQQACAGDPALEREVRSFLDAHVGGGPVGEWRATLRAPSHPERVGAYRILRLIGEGGMGTVYLAEREGEGFQQRVALKLLRTGWGDPKQAERMQRERAILARLEHSGIARLVDGGVSEEGQPWLAMEYVEGAGLLRHAREQKLAVEERLQLFLQVCDAVQYAHQQLVVHRDLKPGNIMVGVDGRVRLLDFGIALLVDPEERPAGITQTAAWLTPAYASPEQVRGERVSTLSDVYALGVLLYELLADARPYEVDARSPAQVEELVCHTMPARPSSKVQSPRLRRRLEGDLDTIVLTAMAKEPERRYGSPAALAEDLRLHLTGMPVHARPASIAYRARKFVARHAMAVLSVALIVLSLAAGIWMAAGQAARADRERDAATREAERATRVSALLVDLFRFSDPTEARGEDLTAREVLERGTERIEREFGDRPDIQASLLSEVAQIHANLGQLGRAESLSRRALEIERVQLAAGSLPATTMLAQLGRILAAQGRRDEAIPVLREAVAERSRLLAAPDTILAQAQADLAWELRESGEHAAAAELFRSAIATVRRLGGDGDQGSASMLLGLAATAHDAGRFDEADSLFHDVLSHYDTAGAQPHPMAATALVSLGMLRRLREDYRGAEPLLRSGARMRFELFDQGHPDRLTAEAEYVLCLSELGNFGEAERRLRAELPVAAAALGTGHPITGTLREALANVLVQTDRAAEAIALMDTALASRRARHGGDHPEVVVVLLRSAEPLLLVGRLDAAAARFEEARAMAERTSGEESVYRMLAIAGLGRVALARGNHADADRLFTVAAGVAERQLRAGHRYRLALDRERARLDIARGNHAAARARLEAVLAGERAVRPAGHPRVVETERMLEGVSSKQ